MPRIRAFGSRPPLAQHAALVAFKEVDRRPPCPDDACILGLDVGSTTTKAVLLRLKDQAWLASVYLRTNGDPIAAARACYRAIAEQISAALPPGTGVRITGLGVTGSGRQLAGLHAGTNGIINEIIAHATAATFFDPKVETLFEIGGQDAKFTRLAHGVPVDYAMNEACAAGTGSFLEEAAWESLGVPLTDIADVALLGTRIPEFSDQCAAFIAADINDAIHTGCTRAEIVAGLVYAIGINYLNRVKGQRPIGQRIFMQGGVCYNRAVPLAMAGLLGVPIVVPPEPGLMGAFGVALQIAERLASGALIPANIDLADLAAKGVTLTRGFYCPGTREVCDRHCAIAVFAIDGHRVPFGGACNKYVKTRQGGRIERRAFDHLAERLERRAAHDDTTSGVARGRVGINRSFLVHHLQPLYTHFFAALGWQPLLPETCSATGIERRNAAFCYPAELAHGYFHTLLSMENPPEYLFLPHVRAVPAQPGHTFSQVCPLVQAEPAYLQAAFRPELDALRARGVRLLTPLLDLTAGLQEAAAPLITIAAEMGIPAARAQAAFAAARDQQHAWEEELRRIGDHLLATLEREPDAIGIVLFSRPYGGLAAEANLGIPGKIASRGVHVLSFDMLPPAPDPAQPNMYWGIGQRLLQSARFVADHPRLFGVFITYFGCGPDSFLLGYYRDLMEQARKPTLVLELDGHTADAGLETRIEAFLDVVAARQRHPAAAKPLAAVSSYPPADAAKPLAAVSSYPPADNADATPSPASHLPPARLFFRRGRAWITTSEGVDLPADDPRVKVLIPWVGRFFTDALATALRLSGLRAVAQPENDATVLQWGRSHLSGKECLPLTLTTGMLLQYLARRDDPAEVTVYFMPTASGPCRFGQYAVFMEGLIRRLAIPNVALLSLTSENAYAGLGTRFSRLTWWGILLADMFEEMRAVLLANARDPQRGVAVLQEEWEMLLAALATGTLAALEKQLAETARRLATIPQRRPLTEVPLIALSGEIYVRRDPFARGHLVQRLAERGFATLCTGIAEWVHYSDHLVEKGQVDYRLSAWEKVLFRLQKGVMARDERRLRQRLVGSGLLPFAPAPLTAILRAGARFISPELAGEAILTVGGNLLEVATRVCGVIAIGPFGCMPHRIAESVMGEAMTPESKIAACPHETSLTAILAEFPTLPFLTIESDGNPFPQRVDARLDAFCLQAERLHTAMQQQRQQVQKVS